MWIGCLESDSEFERKAKKGAKLASAQVSQANIISGIESLTGLCFDSVNGSVLPPYPAYEDRDIEPVVWSHKDKSFDISVGYRNDKYINRVNCRIAMVKAVRDWVKRRYKGGKLTAIAYSMRSAPMAAAAELKRLVPEARIFLIITDLPQFMDLGQSKLKAFLKRIDGIGIKRMQGKFDGFILYAEKMARALDIPKPKYLVMEGSFDASELKAPKTGKKTKAIMYSGTLDMQYGIDLLLKAFMSVEDADAQLWLTGGGNAVEYIKDCAARDSRIHFFGFLPSRAEVLDKQAQAAALVNMRLPSEVASAYCFPSKLFEYMASGTPVLSFALEGIPEEYYEHLVMINDESTAAVRAAIERVLDMDAEAAARIGDGAKRFVTEKKNTAAQCGRICAWLGIGAGE